MQKSALSSRARSSRDAQDCREARREVAEEAGDRVDLRSRKSKDAVSTGLGCLSHGAQGTAIRTVASRSGSIRLPVETVQRDRFS